MLIRLKVLFTKLKRRKRNNLKVIFLGTSYISMPSLEGLIASEHEVIAVITQPDRESGRGRKISFSPVKEAALEHDIKVLQPEKINTPEFLKELKSLAPDIFVLVSYAKMIPKALCDIAPYGCINLHPSLLPRYRGSGPIRGPILNGDEAGGVSIMQIAPEMDAGDIILQQEIALDPKETLKTYEEKAAKAGALLLLKAIESLEAGSAVFTPQDHSKATYLTKVQKSDGLIDFSKPAIEIERQIRACDPWPSAFTYLDGRMFKIWEGDVVCEETKKPFGSAVNVTKRSFMISTGCGLLKPVSVQMEGKKRMSCEEFLRGYKLKEDTVFGKQS